MFSLKTNVIFGDHCALEFPWKHYSKIFLVTDEVLLGLGICDPIIHQLQTLNLSFRIFNQVEPDPSLDTAMQGLRQIEDFHPDAIVAIGGGSVIDAAKVMRIFAAKVPQSKSLPRPVFIAVPTTSGSGSEVTSYAVITDRQKQQKIPLVSESLLPDFALLDPEFTLKCPPKLTAESGLDVLTHIIEAYVSLSANVFSDTLAEGAVKLVFQNLIAAYEDGSNREARLKMQLASCMAGVAFNSAGLGINHALSHSLGAQFHIPHGNANALLMPHVIAYNASVCSIRYQALAACLGLPASSPKEGVHSLISAVKYLKEGMRLPTHIRSFPIKEEEFYSSIPSLAKSALLDPCLLTNPKIPSQEDLEKIYEKLI